jgi:D-aspartate ligase
MPLSSGKRLSVLLASASAGGTIAAARYLGSIGLDVGVVSSSSLGAAAWSRYVSRTYSAPPESAGRQFVDRLIEIGKAEPGQILLPTSDQTAWLYTANAGLLAQYFCMYQPSIESMQRILNKELVADAATRAGLAVLPSWNPRNVDELAALAPTLRYPILIKPRSHIQRIRNDKGIVVHSAHELMQKYQEFVAREEDRPADSSRSPGDSLPLLQQFVRVGKEGVHSITGFVDRTGELFVTRRATKVFLRSRPVGVGVCFESLPPAPALSDAIHRLCLELGFFGIFEVEFLAFEGGWALIDFNPRFFNQMGMDIHRGMPTPLLACLDASQQSAALREAVAKAKTDGEATAPVFYDRFTLRAILLAQTVTSRISREDRAHWRDWTKRHAGHAIDVAVDRRDPMPGIIHAVSEIYLGLMAFPRFLRTTPPASPVTARVLTKAQS